MNVNLTVVIPCKDSAKDLVVCLSSLAVQVVKPVSIIIVDDSDNETIPHLVIPLFPNLPITYLKGPGEGLPRALNLGLDRASTNYLAWLNSDDYYFGPFSLASVASYLEEPSGFVFGNCLHVSPGYPLGKFLKAWRCYMQPYTGGQNIFTGSLFFSKALWRSYGGFPDRLDLAFEYDLLETLFRSATPSYVNNTIAVFNDHGCNLSAKFAGKLVRQKSSLLLPKSNTLLATIDRLISHLSHCIPRPNN